jgi:hypothetical protein
MDGLIVNKLRGRWRAWKNSKRANPQVRDGSSSQFLVRPIFTFTCFTFALTSRPAGFYHDLLNSVNAKYPGPEGPRRSSVTERENEKLCVLYRDRLI